MAGREHERVALGELDHRLIRAAPTHQQRARRFAEGETEFDAGNTLHQRFMNVFNRFDEMALTQDKINLVGLVDFYRGELHSVAPFPNMAR